MSAGRKRDRDLGADAADAEEFLSDDAEEIVFEDDDETRARAAALDDEPMDGIDEDDLMEVDEETLMRMMAAGDGGQGEGEDEEDEVAPDFEPLRDDSLARFTGHSASVFCLAVSPTEPGLVASGGGDDRAFVWNCATGALVAELAGHAETVTSIAFSADSKYLATGALDGAVFVWSPTSGERLLSLEGPAEVTALFWHPRGAVLVATSKDATVWMWQVPSGNVMQVFSGHFDEVMDGGFTPDGKTLVTVSADASLITWAPKTGAQTARITGYPFHETAVHAMAVSPDGALVLTAALDASVRISSVTTGKVLGELVHEHVVEGLSWFPGGEQPWCATGDMAGTVRIWDTRTRKVRSEMRHPAAVIRVKWHPSRPLVFTACTDGVIRAWDVRTGSLVAEYHGHANVPLDLVVSADGATVVSAGDDRVALVFSTAAAVAATDGLAAVSSVVVAGSADSAAAAGPSTSHP